VEAFASKLKKRAEGAEKNFRAALAIYQSRSQYDSLDAAAVKNELAWILSSQVAESTTENSRARIDEAERLYFEALGVREKLAGADSDLTLSSVLVFGDFYTHWVNFEKAMPLYERYVAAIEKNYGSSAKALVPGLRGLIQILVITMQDELARQMAKRITSITGRDEPLPTIYPQLGLRSRTAGKAKLPDFKNADRGELFPTKSGARGMSQTDDSLRGAGQMDVPVFRFRQIVLEIVVDEEGNVMEVRNRDSNVKVDRALEEEARTWKFRPFVYKGVARKMRGAISYSYNL
jgi:tetratricopeptide (TPR) repeat protein